MTDGRIDVAVVGGGLAGLAAATFAARAGAKVTLFEAREVLGGRARSEQQHGFTVNQGAHALYRAGAGLPILRELGVDPKGGVPMQRGGRWLREGEAIPFRKLGVVGGVAGLRMAARLTSARAARTAEGRSIAEWLDENTTAATRPFAEMLVRTTCYSADLTHQDAAETLTQVRRGARGVLYLHGGWATLVAGLTESATAAGVTISHDRVLGIEPGAPVVGVTLGSGATVEAGSVIIATGGAAHADRLLGGASATVARWAAEARPVRAACLDLSLRRLPAGRHLSAYGLGEPIYLVDHASTAEVAPNGAALVHCLFYEPDLAPDADHRARLEAGMDALQPGWRDEVVDARFSRQLVVAHDRPQPGRTGTDRPHPLVDDALGVLVAGDWLTADGLLADAALSSGKIAGVIAAKASRATPVPAG